MPEKPNPSDSVLQSLNQEIIACTKCPRLIPYLKEVAEKKVRRHMEDEYWGKPVPSFGDPEAGMLVLGLAPGAHGANRTGRMFTGDSSGEWLYKALYEAGFANQPESTWRDDGLELRNAWITGACHCAPPQNKPLKEELHNCQPYLEREIAGMPNLKLVLCLGGIAFRAWCRIHNLKGLKFGHLAEYKPEKGPLILCSYHPSRQNTQTGRLKWPDWMAVFHRANDILNEPMQ